MVICAEMSGNSGRIFGLVILCLREADGKRLHRPLGTALHERHDRTRIHPSGQKDPEIHVSHHAFADSGGQQRVELVNGLFIRSAKQILSRVFQGLPGGPVA